MKYAWNGISWAHSKEMVNVFVLKKDCVIILYKSTIKWNTKKLQLVKSDFVIFTFQLIFTYNIIQKKEKNSLVIIVSFF
jgi:hypothetical protein